MKINKDFKKKIDTCVVRIIAEDIDINWNLPYIKQEPSKGQGTGFFIDNKGHILTCAHVVKGAINLYIEIPSLGSEKYNAIVIGICSQFDIALIKCTNYKSKIYVELGDSNNVDVGMQVMVVGYPVSNTTSGNSNNLKFTTGIIKGQQNGMIETDSTINPGNSGGPLFCNDKIIGINSMKLKGDGLENIGFAIPINNYKIIKDCFKDKIIYRPNLLFEYNNTNKEIVKGLTNNAIDNGVLVRDILEYSPFINTNIKKDTIIYKINDMIIDNYGLIENYRWFDTSISIDILLNNFKNNDIIKISYYNNSEKGSCKIKLTPFIPPIRIMFPVFEEVPYLIIGGMIFMNLTINHLINSDNINISCLMLDSKESIKNHIIISFIFPNTKANMLNNIKKDDFITKVNNIDVSNIEEFKKALIKPIIINGINYIKIEEKYGKSIIMTVQDIVDEDILFSKIYKYPVNKIL